jgi:ferredoxin
MKKLKIMPKRGFDSWINRLLSRKFRVVGPQERHGQYVFDEITRPEQIAIDYTISTIPPKKYLLPPREVLFNFNTQTMEINPVIEAEPTVLLAMHSCDMHALKLLDEINNTGYADQHYQARRAQTYVVSLDCNQPCSPQSFCKSMNTVSVPNIFDLHFTDIGDSYMIEVGSEKGEELLKDCVNVWDASEADHDRLGEVMAEKWENFDEYRLNMDVSELPDVLGKGMHSPMWNELAEICLSCGACTQVCPTCYCFDVEDEVDLTLENGQRVRTWDSCQIDKFAIVAGGHDFRSQRAGRIRHRLMRKGKWQYEAYGQMGCIGCGRCGTACIVNINMIDSFNQLHAEQQAEAGTETEVQA